MKKILSALIFTIAAIAAIAADPSISLAEARGRIGDAVSNPAVMTSTVRMLSADDQKAFLADCNEAIGKMPGSAETKAAAYLTVNRAALKGAGAVSGKDMTTEAAVAKLYYLFSLDLTKDEIKEKMEENLRGELSK